MERVAMLLLSVLLRLTNGFLTDSGAPAGAPVIFGPAASTGVLAGRFVLPPSALLPPMRVGCERGGRLLRPDGRLAPSVAAAHVRATAATAHCPAGVRLCSSATFSVLPLCAFQPRLDTIA